MPRVDGSSSSAVPPSTSQPSASHATRQPDVNLHPRPMRARTGALADLPVPRANAPRVQAGGIAVAVPARGRVAATLDRVRGAGQALANVGAQAARAGAAVGQYALHSPLVAGGVGVIAVSTYNMHRAEQRNDMLAFADSQAMARLAALMLGVRLAYVTVNRLFRTSAPSHANAQTMSDAVDMLNGLDGVDMTAETGRHTLYVIDHLQDIALLPRYDLHPEVRAAVRQAGDNPQQLIRNLVGVLTANPPVYSSRRPPPGAPQAPAPLVPPPALAPRGVSRETLHRAVDMLIGFAGAEEDMTAETGIHTQDVIDHLQDIAARPASLHPTVRRAAQAAGDDAQQLVRNLVAMMRQDPSILPARRQAQTQ